jgi:hypothetical protein
MLRDRKGIQLTLDKRYKHMTAELASKKERLQKMQSANLKRQQAVLRLEQQLLREESIEIPAGLAAELSSKLEQYENQHSYSNIILH